MGLSCGCDDFDKSDYDHWWEPGRPSVPPSGERCCECNALLPPGEKRATILHGEVYEPDEPCPGWPDVDEDVEFEAWADRTGWDWETERCERYTSEYRCERCADLADAIEALGYCMIAPGELIDSHAEYVNEHAAQRRHTVIWKQNPDGVWHPRTELAEDRLIAALTRLARRARSWLVWGWRHDLQFRVWHPLMRAAGYQYAYDYPTKTYYWKRRERRLPPWLREAA